MLATLVIGDSDWVWPTVAILSVATGLLGWAYWRLGVVGRVRAGCLGLKSTAFLLIASCLFEPLWSGTRAEPGANLFLMLADNSLSLSVADGESNATPRSEALKQVATDKNAAWVTRLEQDFDVRRYLFDARLRSTSDFAELDFRGTSSSLQDTLSTLRDRFRKRPVAGVLLLTDGNATDAIDRELDLEGLPPIYPVVFGSREKISDVAIRRIHVSQTSFEDAPVTVRADVQTVGFENHKIEAKLLDEAGEIVRTALASVEGDGKSMSFRFQFRPAELGLSFYRVEVAPISDVGETVRSEVTLENNSRLVKVDRGGTGHRVLYIAGRPNWEYKFLRRAIADDEHIKLVAQIRIADKEPKFNFLGRVGESANPLFRGMDKKGGEEVESFDEAVIMRLNTKDSDELRKFPKTEDELFQFDAVIIDDIEAAFFSPDQHELLERYVSERGGAVLMLGGQESFRQGKYQRTPIGEMLPVYLDRAPARAATGPFRVSLSRDGWLNPWVRLRKTEQQEQARLEQMPEFRVVNRLASTKPLASTLAVVKDTNGMELPVLVAHRYGKGKCAALLIGDLWRWQLRRSEDMPEDDIGKAWRQMLRWLVVDVKDRLDVSVSERPDIAPSAIVVQARVRDDAFRPRENATVKVEVVTPSGEKIPLEAEQSVKEPGLYETVYVPRSDGAFRATVTVKTDGLKEPLIAGTGWISDPHADEFRSVTPNHALMEHIAGETGGEVIAANRLLQFAESLPTRKVPITETWTYPLWHQTWFFLAAIACLVGEWGLRRVKGLP
ncbi:MAG: glutamine amidotransferase [Planctomycetota bacterium]|nr:glutamine amidotransferase [Planctomycetota bacterium]